MHLIIQLVLCAYSSLYKFPSRLTPNSKKAAWEQERESWERTRRQWEQEKVKSSVKTEQKIIVAQQAYFTANDAVQRATIDTDGTKTATRIKKRQKMAEAELRAAERELMKLGGVELLAASEATLDDDLSSNMAWG